MMKSLGFGSVLAFAMTVLACGKGTPDSSSTLKVTGSIDTNSRSLDNASALAIGSDGRTFSAYVQKTGRFTLELPVGHVYRIIIANSTMRGELRPIGHLVNTTSKGKADVIAVKDGGSLNLGTLRPVGSSSSTLHTKCDCAGSSSEGSKSGGSDKSGDSKDEKESEDGGDDYKCHEKDGDKDRVCQGEADVELEADHAPGDKCAKDDDDDDAPKPKAKSCSTKGNKDGKDDDDKGGSSGGYGGDKAGGDEAGGGSATGSCSCSKQCSSGSSCVASKCTPDAPGGSGGSSGGGTPPPAGPK